MTGDDLAATAPPPTADAPPPTAAAARARARAVVDAHWCGHPPHERDLIDLELVVSELVTNAIRHGGGLAGFEVTPVPGGVRLAVHDRSEAVPSAAYGTGEPPTAHRGNGYGWPLIIRLTRELSVESRPDGGKTIRVLVPLRPAPARLTRAGTHAPPCPPRPGPR
ncbi:ATP-binding protein [Streptomyces sp. SS7]|uniref:ATP-binding protein n=1 Tax=Streptomyces sp. SS7 TaxID=3108485 RepID=UPI0030ED5CEC